jgi:uroporphyrinogen-III decarboxylase
MNSEVISRIDKLIDKLRAAVDSDRNKQRLAIPEPKCVFGTEEPIVWAEIFGYDANDYYADPYFYTEQFLKQKLYRWDNFPDDQMPLTMDIPAWLGWYSEYTYAGMYVKFDSKGVPLIQNDHPLSQTPDIKLLKAVDFKTSGWMPRALKWYDDLCKISNGRLNIIFDMVWWRGGLDLAIQLRGYENFIMDTMERPQFIHDLMKWLTEQRCRWHQGFHDYFGKDIPGKAGLGATFVGDDWINVPFITPEMFRDFVLPYLLEIEKFHGAINSLHSCGNQTPVQQYLLEIKSLPTFEIGAWSDFDQSLKNIPVSKGLGISIKPGDVLLATEEQMEKQLREITKKCCNRKYNIGTSGLSPVSDDISDFVSHIRTWTKVVKKVMAEARKNK